MHTRSSQAVLERDNLPMHVETPGYECQTVAGHCGRTDLRKGVDGLAQMIGTKYDLNPVEKNVLFLCCGGRGNRIKGLLWKGNGFLLLYKRLEDGFFSWPRTQQEALELTREQYSLLMIGLNPVHPKIREV